MITVLKQASFSTLAILAIKNEQNEEKAGAHYNYFLMSLDCLNALQTADLHLLLLALEVC